MIVTRLDNEQEVDWKPERKNPKKYRLSKLTERAISVIKSILPTTMLVYEARIPGSRLRLDIWIPMYKIVIEVQGIQHYKFSQFYHGTKNKQNEQMMRDRIKREWCEYNGIEIIDFPYDVCEELWKNKIMSIIKQRV